MKYESLQKASVKSNGGCEYTISGRSSTMMELKGLFYEITSVFVFD